MNMTRTLKIQDTLNFFEELDKVLTVETHIGLIGGTALEFINLRESTRDIDIVFFSSIHNNIKKFIANYSKEYDVEIDYGEAGSFSSMLLDVDMFKNPKFRITEFKVSYFRHVVFKNLILHIPEPKYFILIKLEAASTRGQRDFEDAKKIKKHFKISKQILQEAYNELNIEIEMIPRMKTEFEIFMKDVYG